MRIKGKPIVLAIALMAAFGLFVSIPYFLAREATEQTRAATAKRIDVEAANGRNRTVTALGGKLVFDDMEKQSREFLDYYHTIELTPEQESIKAEVLKAMPAACCSDSTAYTCCCTCNLSKTIWGLSNYVIADRGAKASELREVINAWLYFTNPDGYRGNACYRGGCDREFKADGCGGMSESELVL